MREIAMQLNDVEIAQRNPRRQININVRMSVGERKALEQLAKSYNASLSDVVRGLLRAASNPALDPMGAGLSTATRQAAQGLEAVGDGIKGIPGIAADVQLEDKVNHDQYDEQAE